MPINLQNNDNIIKMKNGSMILEVWDKLAYHKNELLGLVKLSLSKF